MAERMRTTTLKHVRAWAQRPAGKPWPLPKLSRTVQEHAGLCQRRIDNRPVSFHGGWRSPRPG